jgi:prophage regulatory protein
MSTHSPFGEHAAHLNIQSTILRRKQVQTETGYSRSTIYARMSEGLWPKPIRLGARAIGWPAREIWALNEARIGGASDADLRELVQKLEQLRIVTSDPAKGVGQ